MTTARIERRLVRNPERRDVIGFLLLHRIEVTDRYPGLMLAAVGALIVLAGVLEKVMP